MNNKLQVVAGTDYDEASDEYPQPVPKPGEKGTSDWWIDNLEPGTIFLCKRKNSGEFVLTELCLQARTEKGMVHLISPSQTQPPFWADPHKFSRAFDWVETLLTAEEFNAKWAKLKPNETLVGPDGKTYTKGQ